MSKVVKKVFKSPIGRIGIPLALSFAAPGLGSALGGALGATGAGASALGSGLLGAGIGGLSGGGFKGALLGGLSGAGGGYLSGGGSVPGLGSVGGKLGAGGMGPTTPGTGLLGKVGSALSGGGSSSFGGGGLSNVLSGINTYQTQSDMEDKLLEQQKRAETALNPYQKSGVAANSQLSSRLAAGFSAPDLANDPGYQFQLAEGNKQLDAANAARGMYYSGQALKDAQTYGQGLADQTYNAAYDRWLSQNQQLAGQASGGQTAANSLASTYGQTGLIGAGRLQGQANTINRTLSSVLGGGQRYVIGQRPDGTYIYSDEV